MLWNTYDDTNYEGHSSFDRRHVFNIYYIYDLPFFRDQTTLAGNLLGGWQISGATFFRTGTPFSVVDRTNDIAGVGDGASVSRSIWWATPGRLEPVVLRRRRRDQNFWFNPAAFASRRPARSATRRAT